jgi:membrane fusion protein, multidrug efflux system
MRTRNSSDVEFSHMRLPGKSVLVWWVLLALTLIATSTFAVHHFLRTIYTDDAQISGHILPVSSRINGSVKKVLVENDQVVAEGQPLVIIDSADLDEVVSERSASVEQLKASLQVAEDDARIAKEGSQQRIDAALQALVAAKSQEAASEAKQRSAVATLAASQAADAQQQASLERSTRLYDEHLISHQSYTDAVGSAAVAHKTLESQRALLDSATADHRLEEARQRSAEISVQQSRESIYEADAAAHTVKMKQADLALAEAQLREALYQQQRTIIRSPVKGIVAARTVELGQNVQPGDPLLSIVDTTHLWVLANFKETQLRDLHLDEQVIIGIDAYGLQIPGHIIGFGAGSGSVFSLIPPDNASGNFVKVVQRIPVRIDLNSTPKQPLRPGMSVTVRVSR